MNVVRKRRLIVVLSLLVGAGITTALVLFALGENLNHFYTPTDLVSGKGEPGQSIRIGGLVVEDSVKRTGDSLTVEFGITDSQEEVTVRYTGILPDLFREGQGIVATGKITPDRQVEADEVLAKHDENYMPPEALEAIERAGHPGKSAESGGYESKY